MTVKIEEQKIRDACANASSMTQAAAALSIHFGTFKRLAEKLGCYNANQGGKGHLKPKSEEFKISLDEILEGKHPQYQTYKLKNRLIKEGLKENKCECCGIMDWNQAPLNMELDHIDGNRTNHSLRNLRMICPNCHAQTDTYRAKNIKKH